LLPTFTYLALEAIADAAVLEGLPRAMAQRLAANSVYSAAALALAKPDVHPAALRNSAESPGGVTIRATRELERGGYRASIMNAITEATKRSAELNK
jgi:pyrroline-5-carboxylate reductase